MTTLAAAPLPAVHAYETDDEVVLEIELPDGERRVTAELEGGVLRLRVPRPPAAPHAEWRVHPEAWGC